MEPDPAKGEVSYRWPQILPGGKEVLFTAVAAKGEKTIGLLSVQTGLWRPLFKDGTHPRYAFGYLFFVRGTSLLATPFAPPWRDPEQPPITVLEDVWSDSMTGFAYLEVSANGSLVYVPSAENAAARLVWVDRGGAVTPLSQKQLPYWTVALSPDATRLAAAVRGREPGLWVSDLARDAWIRLTNDRASGAAWTRDGKRLIYGSGRSGSTNIFGIPADGGGAAEQLTFGAGWQIPDLVTQDGKTLIYETLTTTGWDLMSLALAEPRQTKPFLASPSDERFAAISPNGRWVAYSSSESGEEAVYVRRFDGSGGRWRVAPSIGRAPVWGRDGRELFYRDSAKMMVVQVSTEPEFAAQSPRVLFEIATLWSSFDIAPDGRHFVMIMDTDQAETMPPQLVIIPDWLEELKVKMRQTGSGPTGTAVR